MASLLHLQLSTPQKGLQAKATLATLVAATLAKALDSSMPASSVRHRSAPQAALLSNTAASVANHPPMAAILAHMAIEATLSQRFWPPTAPPRLTRSPRPTTTGSFALGARLAPTCARLSSQPRSLATRCSQPIDLRSRIGHLRSLIGPLTHLTDLLRPGEQKVS